MGNQVEPFEPMHFYHLYSHAVGAEQLFRTEENYHYFMQRYAAYVPPVAATYAFCLMPNHFHFLIQIRPADDLAQFFGKVAPDGIWTQRIGQQIGSWLNAYAKAYNRRYQRRGRLFVEGVRRKRVTNERYLYKLVHYIHTNPVHHGFVSDPDDWPFSSYQRLSNDPPAYLEAEIVLGWFGGPVGFRAAHQQPCDRRLTEKMEVYLS